MSLEDSEKKVNTPEPVQISVERRSRRALLFSVCAALFWLTAVFVNCYLLHNNGYKQINSSLGQTITAFSHALNSRSELLNNQAEALAKDPRWQKPLPSVLDKEKTAAAEQEAEQYQQFLQEALQTTEAGVILLLNDKKQVVGAAERSNINLLSESVAPAPLVENGGKPEEKAEAEKHVSVVPELGTLLEQPAVAAAYEFAEIQSGYMCLKSDGAVVGAVVVPLTDGKKVKGAFLLGEILSDKVLNECSQGMMEGVLALVVDHKVLAAFDKRTAKRPAPLLLTSLEDMADTWIPGNAAQRITLKEGEPNASPEKMEVAGRPWSALSLELSSGGKHPIGWVLFLADTSSVEEAVHYNGWFFIIAIALFFPFSYFLAWKL